MHTMTKKQFFSNQTFVIGIFLIICALSFSRALLRTQTTLIGYELGSLKKKEAELLAERSLLNMELAKLTTRQHLQLLSEDLKKNPTAPGGEYASQ